LHRRVASDPRAQCWLGREDEKPGAAGPTSERGAPFDGRISALAVPE
jgi:hypothetical protein